MNASCRLRTPLSQSGVHAEPRGERDGTVELVAVLAAPRQIARAAADDASGPLSK